MSTIPTTTSPMDALLMLLRVLKLPTVARHAEEVAQKAEREGWTFGQYLRHLVELEVEERRRRRIERNLRDSELPGEKTLATLERKRLAAPVAKMLPTLCEGGFLERGDNVLLFGLPGRGKTHVVCAIGHELIRRGHRVLFTFLAERYERKSVLITSNLVFSEWNRIFKDPMTTAAAIDRLVHHAVILEMSGTSVRADQAKSALKEANAPTTTTTTITGSKSTKEAAGEM